MLLMFLANMSSLHDLHPSSIVAQGSPISELMEAIRHSFRECEFDEVKNMLMEYEKNMRTEMEDLIRDRDSIIQEAMLFESSESLMLLEKLKLEERLQKSERKQGELYGELSELRKKNLAKSKCWDEEMAKIREEMENLRPEKSVSDQTAENMRCKLMEAERRVEEQRCKLVEADRTVEEQRCKLVEADRTVEEQRCKLVEADRTVEELRCKLLEADRTVEELRCKQLEADRKVEELRCKLLEADRVMEDLKCRNAEINPSGGAELNGIDCNTCLIKKRKRSITCDGLLIDKRENEVDKLLLQILQTQELRAAASKDDNVGASEDASGAMSRGSDVRVVGNFSASVHVDPKSKLDKKRAEELGDHVCEVSSLEMELDSSRREAQAAKRDLEAKLAELELKCTTSSRKGYALNQEESRYSDKGMKLIRFDAVPSLVTSSTCEGRGSDKSCDDGFKHLKLTRLGALKSAESVKQLDPVENEMVEEVKEVGDDTADEGDDEFTVVEVNSSGGDELNEMDSNIKERSDEVDKLLLKILKMQNLKAFKMKLKPH